MSNFGDSLEKCFSNGSVDLKALLELVSINFENLSLNDVRFIESECSELHQKFENAEKVECYKTHRLQSLGFNETAYFSLDEIDLVKSLTSKKVEKGEFDFEVKKIKISKDVLVGHIRDRKEWEDL